MSRTLNFIAVLILFVAFTGCTQKTSPVDLASGQKRSNGVGYGGNTEDPNVISVTKPFFTGIPNYLLGQEQGYNILKFLSVLSSDVPLRISQDGTYLLTDYIPCSVDRVIHARVVALTDEGELIIDYTFIVTADLNRDGRITLDDVNVFRQYNGKTIQEVPPELVNALNIYVDGYIDLYDFVAFRNRGLRQDCM